MIIEPTSVAVIERSVSLEALGIDEGSSSGRREIKPDLSGLHGRKAEAVCGCENHVALDGRPGARGAECRRQGDDPDGSFGKRGRPRDFRRVTASNSLLLNVRGRTVLSGARGEHRNRTQDYEGAANDP